MSELARTRESFWRRLGEEIRSRDTGLTARKPTGNYYYKNGIGGEEWHIAFQAKIQPRKEIGCHLILKHDKVAFEALQREKKEIVDEIGEPLEWVAPEWADTTRYRIYTAEDWDLFETSRWGMYIDWLLTRGERFDATFRHRLAEV